MSSRAGDARTFQCRFRPVGRRALRFIASHDLSSAPATTYPECPCPHGPVMHDHFMRVPARREKGPPDIRASITPTAPPLTSCADKTAHEDPGFVQAPSGSEMFFRRPNAMPTRISP